MTGYHRRSTPPSGAFSRFVLSLGLTLVAFAGAGAAFVSGVRVAPVGYDESTVDEPQPLPTPGTVTVTRVVSEPGRTVTDVETESVAVPGDVTTETETTTATESVTATEIVTEVVSVPAAPVTIVVTTTTTVFTPGWP